MMRRFMSMALIGLAVAGAAGVAGAQGTANGQGAPARVGQRGHRAGFDSVRARRMDSLRVARGDTARAGRGMRRGGPRAALAGLDLTAQQRTSIQAINKKYGAQLQELRKANKPQQGAQPSTQLREQMKTIMEHEQADIRAVLTPEQQTRFDAQVAKMKNGRGHGHDQTKIRGGR